MDRLAQDETLQRADAQNAKACSLLALVPYAWNPGTESKGFLAANGANFTKLDP